MMAKRLSENYLAMVTMLADRTRRRVIILISLRMLRPIKTIPDGRAGWKGLISGIVG
jgi:hypothetical protein